MSLALVLSIAFGIGSSAAVCGFVRGLMPTSFRSPG